jgi:hypothetical protein
VQSAKALYEEAFEYTHENENFGKEKELVGVRD